MKKFRILILEWEKEKILWAIERGLLALGHEVCRLVLNKESQLSVIKKAIEEFKPTFALTHNFYVFDMWKESGTEFEELFRKLSIPLATWYWDNPRSTGSYAWVKRILYGPYPKDILFFMIDPEHVSFLKERGVPSSYLPLAADEKDWKSASLSSDLKARFSCPVSFVGKPCAIIRAPNNHLEEMRFHYLEYIFAEFVQIFKQTDSASQISETEIPLQMAAVGSLFGEFFSKSIYHRKDFDLKVKGVFEKAKLTLTPPVFREFNILWGRSEFFYSWYLLNESLFSIKDLGLRVFGGPAWREKLLGDYSHETPYLSDDELKALFSYSQISLCHTKWPFRMAVHERPFLILASGGFVLTDERECLHDLFTKDEIATYGDTEDLREKIKFYLANEKSRVEMAKNGHARVLKDHNYQRRADELIRLASAHFGFA